eukprot:CCRYP_015064-RA/>CCRYP_015064-RA protein AED:0.14 eAED:0.14 QI:27/1/1/1/0/0/2/355/331
MNITLLLKRDRLRSFVLRLSPLAINEFTVSLKARSTMNDTDRVRFHLSRTSSSVKSPSAEANRERRPSTPHPSDTANNFQFDGIDSIPVDGQLGEEMPLNGCIVISLSTVLNTLRGGMSLQNNEDRGFFPSFKAMVQKTLKPLNCAECEKSPRHLGHVATPVSLNSCLPVDDALEEHDLMNRLQSWRTLESLSEIRSKVGVTPRVSKQVQFQYPPITSVRLRPRTESDEIDQLFFAPDELDEIEADRSDTKAADDIETLCVIADPSDDIDSMPGVTESLENCPSDEINSSSLSCIGQRVSASTSPSNSSREKKRKGIVRGVQILLREKSIG